MLIAPSLSRYYNPKTRGLDLDGFLEDIHVSVDSVDSVNE